MELPEISALIFDFDGVILDTETPDFNIWRDVFEGYGTVLDPDIWKQSIGTEAGTFNIYQHLEEMSGRAIDRQAVRADMRPRYLAQIESNPILPGILDYISGARALGLKVGVASSSDSEWVRGHLNSRGMLGLFESITTRDDVKKAKPDPEIYLKAADRLGVYPANALAIEDSLNGLNSARSAGVNCVVVPNPMTADMAFEGADLRLNALSDMPLQSLLKRFSQAL